VIRWRRLGVAAVVAGSLLLTGGLWLPAKAAVAQVLLRAAWARSDGGSARPWPWARTHPVARLEVPRLGVDRIVLAGDQGAALAFAPGHVDGTAPPGTDGNTVIAGHRDTVFAFVGELRLGDEIRVVAPGNRGRRYSVTATEVVHERDTRVLEPTLEPTLTLITCYPLDSTRPRGPLRYVVRGSPAGRNALPSPSERRRLTEQRQRYRGDRR
jgi:sortase A